jgi:hypothetical protein
MNVVASRVALLATLLKFHIAALFDAPCLCVQAPCGQRSRSISEEKIRYVYAEVSYAKQWLTNPLKQWPVSLTTSSHHQPSAAQ